jgi:3,4-dihydroxy 2-butanone 4-phosphate synthase/GTP cyclohydrolase II
LFNDLPHARVNYKIPSSHNNAVFSVKAALVTGGGDLLSYPKDTNDAAVLGKDLVVGAQVVQIKEQLNGTLTSDSEITSTSFPVDYNEFDLESPAEGFASIPEAIEDIRRGKVVKEFLCFSACYMFLLFWARLD